MMKFLSLSSFVIFLSVLTFVYLYNANAISPKFPSQTLQDKTQDVNVYSHNNNNNNNYLNKSTEDEIRALLNMEAGAISSNGTHAEINLFFEESLNNLTNALISTDTLSKVFFINILIDSDGDENTGFLGYDHRYVIRNNGSLSQQDKIDNNLTTTIDHQKTINQQETNLTHSLQDSGLLTSNELNLIINDTSKSEYILSQLEWIIRGYEIVHYHYTPEFLQDNAYPNYLTIIPNGFKVTLDLEQLDYPEYYSILINTGIKSHSYKSNDFFSKIHIPKPDIYIENKVIKVNPGFNSIVIPFNSTDYFDLSVNLDINEKDIPERIEIDFPEGKEFNIFDGNGEIPLEIMIDPKSNLTSILLPLNISYSVIGANDFIQVKHNNSLTSEQNYSKNTILDLDVERDVQLINLSQIPPQYMAVLIGAIFSIFIPSMARLVKGYRQTRTANNILKHLMNKKEEIEDNEDLQKSINRLANMYRILRYKFIKGNISKDQYEILKENLHEILADLVSKKEKKG